MASVAKKIFSKLGAKQHRSDHASTSPSLQDSEKLPKDFENLKSPPPSYSHYPDQQDQSMSWSHPDAHELANSTMIPEMAGDWTAASYELPETHIAEMAGSDCPTELGGSMGMWEDNYYAENYEDWDLPSLPLPKERGFSPKLEIDTSFTHTSRPKNWIDTPLSATFISPLSALGNLQPRNGFSPLEISPTDSDASGTSFLTDSGYSSAMQSATFSAGSFSRFPSINEVKGKQRDFGAASEAWINDTAAPVSYSMSSIVANPVLTSSNPDGATPEVNRPFGRFTESSSLKTTTSHWHDASSLVLAFSESLDAHLQHTKSKLQSLSQTSITLELNSMSRTSIISIGLDVLTDILEGRTPTAMTQIFAFTHIACAMAIATDDDETKVLTQKWFQHTLQWSAGLRGRRQQKGYKYVAKAIWQPIGDLSVIESFRSVSDIQQNSLSTSCKHFLDLFEILDLPRTKRITSTQHSDFVQASFEHNAKICVLGELVKRPQLAVFLRDIHNVEGRLQKGQVTSVRELELELVFAGKLASQSDTLYDLFLQQVTTLCAKMYLEEPFMMYRTRCHVLDIGRIRQLMPDDNYDEGGVQNETNHLQEQRSPLLDMNDEYKNLFQLDLDFGGAHEHTTRFDKDHDVAMFSRDCLELMQYSHDTHVEEYPNYPHKISTLHLSTRQKLNPPSIKLHPSTLTPTPTPTPAQLPRISSTPPSPSQICPTSPFSESVYRCHCGYIPTGEEKWKASNLRRHNRTQHATESKVYICRWRGCKSSFTRSDNLRCHVREKGHYEGAGRDRDEDWEVTEEGGKIRKKKKRSVAEGLGMGGSLR
ncbi:uncharacterized protein RSE6_08269 [Rhynchosporium secalis]|uniref:C2H2-type domain-containing protein n=1 Tax=Rhynchosporium secalis TaxID=38038 RepID=A0A1E1MF12_RHYSE|nr:uncharacterized protein RSE6_08269 [Rhynchosporium secalis]